MKSTDYKTLKQAKEYHLKRFGKGLRLVSDDELDLVGQWIFQITSNRPVIYVDIGTGTGRILKEILTHSPKKIFAVDQSESMFKQLKLNYKNAIKDKIVEAVFSRSDKIALSSGIADISTSLHLFKHLSNVKPTLQEINRILKKDGYLIFDILNKDSIIRFNLGSCFALDKKEVILKLQKTGFKVLKIVPLHTFGETIYNLPGLNLIHPIDKFITKMPLSFGTKFFVLAKKNV